MKGLIPKGNICFEYFKNQNHLFFFLYKLTTYHWKCFKKSYSFVVGSTSIKMKQKLWSRKILNTFVPTKHNLSYFPKGTWLFPEGTRFRFFLRKIALSIVVLMCPREQLKTCFPGEQMCLKLCVIITFASKFWLNCFQL